MLRNLLRSIAASTLVLPLFAWTARAQTDFSKVEIETRRITDGVHMLVGAGGNIGVSTGPDGIVVIDDQYAPLHAKIVAALSDIQAGPVRFVLNTHWHGDHTGGNEALGEAGALIVAHDAVRTRMGSEQVMVMRRRTVPASPPGALPVVTFGTDTTLHVNGDALHVVHLPNAHTDGDAIVHFKRANVIHTGDLFFVGRYPFIDLDSGGSIEGLIGAVDRILALANADTRIIPGHGPLANEADLRRYRDMLVSVRSKVQAAIDAGTSLEDAIESRVLAEYDDDWAWGFMTAEVFLRIVYTSLAGA